MFVVKQVGGKAGRRIGAKQGVTWGDPGGKVRHFFGREATPALRLLFMCSEVRDEGRRWL